MQTGIVIVDHGSTRDESNKMLEQVAALFGERFREKFEIVEPAHMELAEPSITTAYAACVKRGAERVVVVPFFLGPGKHWTQDIPQLTAEAAAKFPATQYHVAPVLGIDDLMLEQKFPIEKMIKFYDLADINLAARESSAGLTIKPVLRMPHGA